MNSYLKENKLKLNEIVDKKGLLLNLIWIMKTRTRKSNAEIARVLGINKNKMTRLYKKIMEK